MCESSLLNAYGTAQLDKPGCAAGALHQALKTENAAQVFEEYQAEYRRSLYK